MHAPSRPAFPRRADQHYELPEWLEYYRRMGVSRVYAMEDPQSEPPLDDVLRPFVKVSATRPATACPLAAGAQRPCQPSAAL